MVCLNSLFPRITSSGGVRCWQAGLQSRENGLRALEPLAGWASGGVARVGKLGCTGADSNVGRASGPLARSRLGHLRG